MEVVLVRHAETTWNAESRWQGQADVPLSARGRAEAARLGARLASVPFDVRVASDLSRTRDTAAAIGGSFELDRAWREIDLGAWSGMLHSEVRERFPDEVRAMVTGGDRPIGGAESIPVFEARALAALDAVIGRGRPGQRALVVTHGGVIRAIVMRLLGLRGRPLVGATNTSITHLRVSEGRVRLVSYNCDAHLGPTFPTEAEDATCDVVSGPPHEVIERVIARLGLTPDAHQRFHPPSARSVTRLLSGSGHPALRSYATPALAEP